MFMILSFKYSSTQTMYGVCHCNASGEGGEKDIEATICGTYYENLSVKRPGDHDVLCASCLNL